MKNNNINKDKLLQNLEELLEYPTGGLNPSIYLSEIATWDSIAILGAIAIAEELGNNKLSPEDFKDAKNIDDLINIIAREEA